MIPSHPSNKDIANVLDRIADLLEVQQAGAFRIRAYRRAAETVREAGRPLDEVLADEGRRGLEDLPGIGKSIASVIQEFLHTGRTSMLGRLEGETAPEDLFTTVPGIGHELARDIHDKLGIETLEELEVAAHDGRLQTLRGFGPRRTEGVRQSLAGILSRSARRRARQVRWRESIAREAVHVRPAISTILKVDRQYRERARAGELRLITPRRFNLEGRAWLPIMHVDIDGWSFTAMFSNTAQAHRLGKTNDWVVMYFEKDGEEDQCTVVTESGGPQAGRRVVRGRETECARHYAAA